MATITIEPATTARFDDVEHVFDAGGDARSCQCQWWMMPNTEWSKTSRDESGDMLADEIAAAPPPGLVAYVDGEAAGWVRVGPRTRQVRLGRTLIISSSTDEPLDDESVWAVSCFVVRKNHRRQGLNTLLLEAAVDFAREHGARVIEAYPIDPNAGKKHGVNDLFHGVISTFHNAGFREVARPKPDRPIVALELQS
jgi:GNAT superfamily N-acetyltransferase